MIDYLEDKLALSSNQQDILFRYVSNNEKMLASQGNWLKYY